MVFFSVKSMSLFSILVHFSLLHIAGAITSEVVIQPDYPRITHLLANHYDCSKQNNLRQFSLTRVQKCTQAPSECCFGFFFVQRRKKLKLLADLNLFKRLVCFVLKVHLKKSIYMIVWVGILFWSLYQRNGP